MPKDHDNIQHAPPHNAAAEMAVLGAILFDNNAHQRVADIISPTDFYAPANGSIFLVINELVAAGRVADGVTLSEHFARDGQLLEIGGARYLDHLLDSAAFGPEIVDYARLIHDLALRRELIQIGSEVMQKAVSSDISESGADQIQEAEKKLFALAERGVGSQGFQTFNSALAKSIETATNAFKRDGHIAGVSTGLTELDRMLGGLHPSDLVILAARPSMGKTALATNIAYSAAKRRRDAIQSGRRDSADGAVVGFFSLEMSSDQLATRILSDISDIASDKIRRGDITQRDYEGIREASSAIEGLPLFIDDTGGISISQLAARARRLQRSHGLGLLIIDYLQLVTTSGRNRNDGRVQEVSEITKSLKALAKELQVPIVALSQLSRQVEQRPDKRPLLSDLRESGSIEQDADVVLFIYREAYYLEREEPGLDDTEKHASWQDKMNQKVRVAEVIISKQRHGPIGRVEVGFHAERVRFFSIDDRHSGDRDR